MTRRYYDTAYGQGTRGDNAEWFDNLPVPTSKLYQDDEVSLEDGSTIKGPNGEEYVVTKKKKQTLEDLAKDKIKDEAVSQGQKKVREVGQTMLAGAGAGAAARSVSSIDPTTLPDGVPVSLGGPATPEILGANRIDSAGNILSTGAPEVSGWKFSNIGSEGNYILPAAGAYGLYDLYSNRPENVGTGKGYLQGAASGAAIGSYFGSWGTGIGAGLGIAANALGIGGKSRTKVEEERRQALADQGINIPNYDTKEWEQNEAFRGSRKESDLKGGDIENAATFYGINGYSQADQAKKEAIAQEAINKGLIREHHGTIDLSMTPEYQKFLESQLGGPAPSTSGGGVDRRAIQAETKKARKKAALDTIMPDIQAQVTQGPRYDINPGNLLNNPYL